MVKGIVETKNMSEGKKIDSSKGVKKKEKEGWK